MSIYLRGKSYYYDFVHKGQRYTGCFGQVSRTVAKEEESRKKAEVIELRLNPAKARSSPRFDAFVQEYLEWLKTSKKPLTYHRVSSVFTNLLAYFRTRRLNEISAWEIERYKKTRKDAGKAPATINLELRFLRSLLYKAYAWKKLVDPPDRTVKLLKTPEGKLRFLSEEEEAAILAVSSPALQRLITVGLLTGFRRQELISLRAEAVDLVRGVVTVEACYSKNGDRRTVPICERLQSIFQEAIAANPGQALVLTKEDGTPWSGSSFANAFGRACQKAGIGVLYPHVLRHTFASRLAMANVDLATVKELMGHKNILMTMRYTHLSVDHKRKAVDALERQFSAKSPANFHNTPLAFHPQERQKA